MYNTSKFTTTITMVVSCILCSCSNTVATERITFYSSSDQVKLSLETPQRALGITSSLNPKLLTKHIQPKSKTSLIPVLVVGSIVTLGIMAVVISNNKDKDNTVLGANDDPKSRTQPLLQGTKTHLFGNAPEVLEKWIRTQQHNTNPIAMIPTIVPGTKTPFCGNGTKIRDNQSSRISLSAHDKVNTDPVATDPVYLEKQKAKLIMRVLATALEYWENWPGTQEEKEDFIRELIFAAFSSYISELYNTHLVGSTLMTKALHYFLFGKLPKDVLSNALNLDPKGTWDGGHVAVSLFNLKNMNTDFIHEVVLKEYTEKQIADDYNTVISVAKDIRINADKYAEVILDILEQLIGTGITTDSELISFLPSNKDSLEDHVITPEGLTDYLRWCSNQLTNNVMQAIEYSGILLQKVNNRSIHLYAKLLDFWNNALTLEQKEELTKKIALALFDESRLGMDTSNGLVIDLIVEKYNANFMKEVVNAPFLEEDLEQDRIKLSETVNYILKNADMLAAKILSYFNEPVITTDKDFLDISSNYEPKDNPNLVTVERLARYLRWCFKKISILLM